MEDDYNDYVSILNGDLVAFSRHLYLSMALQPLRTWREFSVS
jgi:hypothetical protein